MVHLADRLRLSRRGALLGLGAAISLGRASLARAAAPTDRQLASLLQAFPGSEGVAPATGLVRA